MLWGRSHEKREDERDGVIHGGHSRCDVLDHAGRVRIVERFEWSTRTGVGVNVFDEVADASAA